MAVLLPPVFFFGFLVVFFSSLFNLFFWLLACSTILLVKYISFIKKRLSTALFLALEKKFLSGPVYLHRTDARS